MTMLKRHLSIALALSIVGLGMPTPSMAASNPRIAVLELHHASISADATERIADGIREGLEREEGYSVISREETQAALKKSAFDSAGASLGFAVEQAMQDYRRLEIGQAQKTLRRALDLVNQETMNPNDVRHLAPAYLLLGELALASGRISEAVKSFEEAARLAPTTTLDKKKYSPRVLKIYSDAHAGLMQDKSKLGAIEIAGKRNLHVYLNGLPKGNTPLMIQNVPSGKHYVTLSKDGYSDALHTIVVSPGETKSIEASLSKSQAGDGGIAGLSVKNPKDKSEVLGKAIVAGRALQADRVALVYVEDDGLSYHATIQSVDVERGRSEVSNDVVFGKGRQERKEALLALLSVLTGGEKTYIASSEPLPDEVPSRSRRPAPSKTYEEKPIWKKPLFWVIVGTVVAGAGAGTAVALSGGGGGPSEVPVSISGGLPASR